MRVVRKVEEELGKPLALIADLQGPKIRVGELPAPRLLADGDEIVVVGESAAHERGAAARARGGRRGAPARSRGADRRRARAAARSRR